MPIRHVVDAVSGAFAGDYSSIFWGASWSVLLFAVAVWWGMSTFRKENA